MRKNKLARMIVTLGVAITMLFAVVAFGGCSPTRHPNSDPAIETQLEIQIRQDWVTRFSRPTAETSILLNDTFVLTYFGTYGDSVVVDISCPITIPNVLGYAIIANIKIYFHNNLIRVWNNRSFFGLEEAYNLGLLSIENLKSIAAI